MTALLPNEQSDGAIASAEFQISLPRCRSYRNLDLVQSRYCAIKTIRYGPIQVLYGDYCTACDKPLALRLLINASIYAQSFSTSVDMLTKGMVAILACT